MPVLVKIEQHWQVLHMKAAYDWVCISNEIHKVFVVTKHCFRYKF